MNDRSENRIVQWTALVALCLAVTLGGAGALAQTDAGTSQEGQTQQEGIDQAFLQAAMQSDMYEINASQLAQERATNEDVRAFAQRMVEDHTATTERLTALAGEIGTEAPALPDPAHQVQIAHLMQQQDAAFDRTYMRQQVTAHEAAVALFEIAAASAQNESLRSFASETLPTLREHLQMARDLQQRGGDGQGQQQDQQQSQDQQQ